MSPGPLGSSTQSPNIDNEMLARTDNKPRTITLDPIVIYLDPDGFKIGDRFYKKWHLEKAFTRSWV